MKLLTYAEQVIGCLKLVRELWQQTAMRYFLWLALYTYGILYHITSSEFWPITISKTWFTPEFFENSMLQKPLLTMFLAVFHLIPITDTLHVFLAKTLFSVAGVVGLTYFSHFVLELTQYKSNKIDKSDLAALMAFLFVLLSPVVRNNFFSIRSDQIAFLCFSLFLLFCGRKRLWPALISLVLIPCFGIKEFIFLAPGSLYFFWNFRSVFTPKLLVTIALSALTVLVWVVALNTESLFYLYQTYAGTDYSLRFGRNGFMPEAAALLLTVGSIGYIGLYRVEKFYRICGLSLILQLLLFSLPQAHPFFIASVIPFVYLPLIVLIIDEKTSSLLKRAASTGVVLIWTVGFSSHFKLPWHVSNIDQLWFIEMSSKIIAPYKLSYLDGQGILPRQKFLPCFVSPEDEIANNGCRNFIKNESPDVLIITKRLFYLGEDIFRMAEQRYVQVYPNFWVLKERMNDEIRSKIDLSNTKPLPIIIF